MTTTKMTIVPVWNEDEPKQPVLPIVPACPMCGSRCDKRAVGRWDILSLWRCTRCDWRQVEG